MARSTRNKIRFHAEKAINDIDRAMEHLCKVDMTAMGRSDRIEDSLPKLVVILDGFKKILIKWRETL